MISLKFGIKVETSAFFLCYNINGDDTMIIPRSKEDYENKSVEELVKEQQLIMNKIIEFENQYILKTNKDDESEPPFKPTMISSPSPTVVWRVISEDLIMLTKLIDEKTRDEYGIGKDFE